MGSETTLRRRRDTWLRAGVFAAVAEEALAAYDRIIGLDLTEVALDASQHKAPMGGEGTGPNYADRFKSGWKWSLLTDRQGIPLAWATAGANCNDVLLLAPTLDAAKARGMLLDVETLHLDRGYDVARVKEECAERGLTDVICPKRRKPGRFIKRKLVIPLGMRWPVERTNSWMSNFGQLRRNTDRRIDQRMDQIALTVSLIIAVKLVKWAKRWEG
jgi:IS5 family transposase